MVLVEFREDLRAFSTVSQFNFYLQNLGLIVFTSHRGYGLLLLINMSMLSSISVLPFYGNRYYFSGMLLINFRLYHHTRERPFLVCVIFTPAHVSLALLSLRKNGDYS